MVDYSCKLNMNLTERTPTVNPFVDGGKSSGRNSIDGRPPQNCEFLKMDGLEKSPVGDKTS